MRRLTDETLHFKNRAARLSWGVLILASLASGCRVCSPQCNLKTGYQVGFKTCETVYKGYESDPSCCPPQAGSPGVGDAYSSHSAFGRSAVDTNLRAQPAQEAYAVHGPMGSRIPDPVVVKSSPVHELAPSSPNLYRNESEAAYEPQHMEWAVPPGGMLNTPGIPPAADSPYREPVRRPSARHAYAPGQSGAYWRALNARQ